MTDSHLMQKLEAMEPNDSIVLERDKDPEGLIHQLGSEFGEELFIERIMSGPVRWTVKITKQKKEGCCGCCG